MLHRTIIYATMVVTGREFIWPRPCVLFRKLSSKLPAATITVEVSMLDHLEIPSAMCGCRCLHFAVSSLAQNRGEKTGPVPNLGSTLFMTGGLLAAGLAMAKPGFLCSLHVLRIPQCQGDIQLTRIVLHMWWVVDHMAFNSLERFVW